MTVQNDNDLNQEIEILVNVLFDKRMSPSQIAIHLQRRLGKKFTPQEISSKFLAQDAYRDNISHIPSTPFPLSMPMSDNEDMDDDDKLSTLSPVSVSHFRPLTSKKGCYSSYNKLVDASEHQEENSKEYYNIQEQMDQREDLVSQWFVDPSQYEWAPLVNLSELTKSDLKILKEDYGTWLYNTLQLTKPAVLQTKKASKVAPTKEGGKTITALFSDLHAFRQIISGNYVELYGVDNCIHIIHSYFKYIRRLYENTPGAEEIIINFLGDIVDGEVIFGSQPWVSPTCVFDQQAKLVPVIWQEIKDLSTLPGLKCVRLECVPGNHGRASSSSKAFRSLSNNFDNMLYLQLQNLAAEYSLNKQSKQNAPILVNFTPEEDKVHFFHIRNFTAAAKHTITKGIQTTPGQHKLSAIRDLHQCDIAFQAHLHHIMIGQAHDMFLMQNGTMLSTPESYANSLGYNNQPQQLVMVSTDNNLVHSLHFFPVSWEDK